MEYGKKKIKIMKTIILVPNKNTYMFQYIDADRYEIFNVYKNIDPNKFVRVVRKLIYFIESGKSNRFYSDWTKYLDQDVQFIIFDSCRPYHRLQKKLKHAKVQPIIYYWNPIKPRDKIEQLKKYFRVYSYSIHDAQKYGIGYNPQFFVEILIEKSSDIVYDGIFIGANKSRLKVLEKLYKNFDNPFFYILRDGKERSKTIKLFDKQMPYEEYLQLLNRSQSIIEVLYTDNADYTLRTMEALFYQKKLITNNRMIEKAQFFNENNIYIFNENTTKEEIQDFLSKPFIPYSEEQIGYFCFEHWLNRFILS